MAEIEPVVVVIWPGKSDMKNIQMNIGQLPKWVRLYILRWVERRKKESGEHADG